MDNKEEVKINNAWGEPYIYKGVKIYPIKLKDALNFYQYVPCLTINKNSIPNPQIIKMNYLEFLIMLSQQKEVNVGIYEKLISLLVLIFREQYFIVAVDEKTQKLCLKILSKEKYIEEYNKLIKDYEKSLEELSKRKMSNNEINKLKESKKYLDDYLVNNSNVITGREFEDIRKIILNQNLIKFDDDLINSEVKQALDEAQEFINKKNGDKQATLDELIISYACEICNGKPQDYNDIKELTIFQFYKGLQRTTLSKQQMMLSTALGMGAISIKDVPSWLEHIPESDMYEDAVLKEEEVSKLKALDK